MLRQTSKLRKPRLDNKPERNGQMIETKITHAHAKSIRPYGLLPRNVNPLVYYGSFEMSEETQLKLASAHSESV